MAAPTQLSARRRRAMHVRAAGLVAGRVTVSFVVAAAAAIHLYLWFDYFHRVHVVGVLFLVNAAAGVLTAAALLVSGKVMWLLAAAGYAVGTLAAFLVSTRWGLFGYRERFWGSWQEAAGGLELAGGLLAAILLAFVLRARRAR